MPCPLAPHAGRLYLPRPHSLGARPPPPHPKRVSQCVCAAACKCDRACPHPMPAPLARRERESPPGCPMRSCHVPQPLSRVDEHACVAVRCGELARVRVCAARREGGGDDPARPRRRGAACRPPVTMVCVCPACMLCERPKQRVCVREASLCPVSTCPQGVTTPTNACTGVATNSRIVSTYIHLCCVRYSPESVITKG